jgi:ParB family chromosome partitioning protein
MNITLTMLAESIGCSRAKLDNYLTFEKALSSSWEAVGNLSRVSSRSAATIYSLSKRGKDYTDAEVIYNTCII